MKLILGLGRTGLSIANFLIKKNIVYRIADSRTEPPLLVKYMTISPEYLPILGKWKQSLLDDIDEIFISPGIAQTELIVIWARQKKISIVSDIELFSSYAQAPIIGVTGSNGKSTVVKLLGLMLTDSGFNVAVCGNIGKPALDCLSSSYDYYVLEISSYQLDYTNKLNLLTGVVLNIAPDHLDRYANFSSYIKTKLSLYKYCKYLVINFDERLVMANINIKLDKKLLSINTKVKYFSTQKPRDNTDFGCALVNKNCYIFKGFERLIDTSKLSLIGKHNISNILASLVLGEQIGIKLNTMLASIKKFKTLKHRLELVVSKNNIDYYNDSKATNASATISAITAITSKRQNVVLIIGGIAKKEDYSSMFELIDKTIMAVVLIGSSSKYFASVIMTTPVSYAASMSEAVSLAKRVLRSGAVLLSPACASFDMFTDFNERGNEFKRCVLSSFK